MKLASVQDPQFDSSQQNEVSGSGSVLLSAEKEESLVQCTLDVDEVMQEEVDFGWRKERGKNSKMNVFIGGRIALRRALAAFQPRQQLQQQQQVVVGAILSNELGAPVLPPQLTGSISHKKEFAVAAVKVLRESEVAFVGVDLERCKNRSSFHLQRRLLSDNEQSRLLTTTEATTTSATVADDDVATVTGRESVSIDKFGENECNGDVQLTLQGPINAEEDVLLRFSFKEAVYKAVNPLLRRHVDFKEVEVYPAADGTALLNFRLQTGELFNYKAEWRRFRGSYWLTCVVLSDPHDNKCD